MQGRGAEELFEGVGREGSGEEVALAAVAFVAQQALKLGVFLDAFGECLYAEGFPDLDHGADEVCGLFVVDDGAGEWRSIFKTSTGNFRR